MYLKLSEPMNQGAWWFVRPHFITAFKGLTNDNLGYAGRPPSASPAAGKLAQHHKEQALLIATALA